MRICVIPRASRIEEVAHSAYDIFRFVQKDCECKRSDKTSMTNVSNDTGRTIGKSAQKIELNGIYTLKGIERKLNKIIQI